MQRVYWLDNLKAFAIFTVVAGHMMSCEAFHSEIGTMIYEELILAFHMPLFAVLSGWFLKYKMDVDFGAQLWKKVISILLPYVVWCALWFLIKPMIMIAIIFAEGALHFGNLVWQLKFFLYDGLCHYGWWFLRALFFCFLFAYLAVWICRGRLLMAGLGSCVLLYGLTLTGVIPNMPEKDSLFKGFVYLYPFFWTGCLFRCFENDLEKWKMCLMPFSIVGFIGVLYFWQGKDSFYSMNTSAMDETGTTGLMLVWTIVWRFFVGAVGALAFLLIFKQCFTKEYPLLTKIGQETLGIYILQSLVYWSLPSFSIFAEWGQFEVFSVSLLISVIIVVLSYFIICIIRKSNVLSLVLFGK